MPGLTPSVSAKGLSRSIRTWGFSRGQALKGVCSFSPRAILENPVLEARVDALNVLMTGSPWIGGLFPGGEAVS